MSKRKKPVTWPNWKTARNDCIEKQFVQIGSSQLHHDSMKSLTPTAFQVYVLMLDASGGKKEFIFPYSRYRDYMTPATFRRARQELISKGFIIETKSRGNERKPNEYAFTHEWREWGKQTEANASKPKQ